MFQADSPFQRHGWILVDVMTQTLVDPTRWVFEARRPYLYTSTGVNLDYDEGGQRMRRMHALRPIPAPEGEHYALSLPAAIVERYQLPPSLAVNQVFWLANLPYDELAGFAPDVYRALIRAGFSAAIPIDHIAMAEAHTVGLKGV